MNYSEVQDYYGSIDIDFEWISDGGHALVNLLTRIPHMVFHTHSLSWYGV